VSSKKNVNAWFKALRRTKY